MAFGSSLGDSLGGDWDKPFDSLASTFCASGCTLGNGMLLTSVALIAPPPPWVPPQFSPRPLGMILKIARANNARCSATEPTSERPEVGSCGKMSASAAILLQRLSDDAHVGDSGLLDGVHYGRESAEGDVLVGANEDRLALGIADFFTQARADLIDVDGIVAQKYLLLAVDGDHQTLFGDLFHRLGVGHGHFDAGLQHGRSHHEDDEQYQYDVHQRCDVDVGEGGLGATLGVGECHYRRSTLSCAWRAAPLWARSTSLMSSRPKSSMRAPNSRMCWMNMLYAMTAGIAAKSPAAVVMRASEMPGATARRVAAPAVPSPWKASMMPQTVPNNPMNGVTAPVVASQGRRLSRLLNSSEAAICVARCNAVMRMGCGACLRNSSYAPSKTASSGLGLNCSATAAMSCRRSDLRNAQMKRLLCTRARRNSPHLEKIMAHEARLNSSRMMRTVLATRPLDSMRLEISPPMAEASNEQYTVIWVAGQALP